MDKKEILDILDNAKDERGAWIYSITQRMKGEPSP